jgi:ribose transport system substrate-binding protein
VPPALVGDALDRAAKAHVVLVSVWNPVPEAGNPVFAYVRPDHTAQGKLMAQWIEVDSHGQGKVLIVEDREFPELRLRVESLQKTMEGCGNCKVVATTDTTIATMAQRVPGAVAGELSRNPSINYIVSQFDTNAFFATEGVRQAGKTGAVKVAGYEGDPQALDLIRTGVQAMSIADPNEWTGWQAVDELNRAFSNVPAENTLVPFRLIDKENVPATKGWTGDLDFRAEYRRLWGLK